MALGIASAVAVLASCDRPTITAPSESRHRPSIAGSTMSLADDPGINPNDTWVAADMTSQVVSTLASTTTFTNPETGLPTTSINVINMPEMMHVVSGYGYDGQVRVTVGYDGSEPSEVAFTRQVGDYVAEYDRTGAFISTQAIADDPIALLGSFQGNSGAPAGSGLFMDDPGADGGGSSAYMNRSPGLPASASLSAAPMLIDRGVSRTDGNHLTVTEVVARGGPAFALPGASSTARAVATKRGRQRQTRTYERRGEKWVLQELRQELEGDSATGARQEQVVRFANVRWNESPKRRFGIAREADMSPGAPGDRPTLGGGAGTSGVAGPNLLQVACPDCDGTGTEPTSPPGGWNGAGPCDGDLPIGEFTQDVSPAGPNTLVLQHGFVSSATTWARMRCWLTRDVLAYQLIAKSLPWDQTYELQAAILHRRLRDENVTLKPIILIGHSNGGMISRYLARNPDAYNKTTTSGLGRQPLDIRGVITIGTPHWGAPAARYVRDLRNVLGLGGLGSSIVGLVCYWLPSAACNQYGQVLISELPGYLNAMQAMPVVDEMQPSSAYHAQFNGPAAPETFARFGIQSYSWERWRMWGLAGDFFCNPESSCGGRAWVQKTDRVYHRSLHCAVVGALFFRWEAAAQCTAGVVLLRTVDGLFNKFTSPNERFSDGIVPRWSQLYPNIPNQDQYPVLDGDSHIGETKSQPVGARVENILRSRFNIDLVRQTPRA